jgi:hypothetical protein
LPNCGTSSYAFFAVVFAMVCSFSSILHLPDEP